MRDLHCEGNKLHVNAFSRFYVSFRVLLQACLCFFLSVWIRAIIKSPVAVVLCTRLSSDCGFVGGDVGSRNVQVRTKHNSSSVKRQREGSREREKEREALTRSSTNNINETSSFSESEREKSGCGGGRVVLHGSCV